VAAISIPPGSFGRPVRRTASASPVPIGAWGISEKPIYTFASAGPAGYDLWRLLITESQGGTSYAVIINEIKFLDSGGAEIPATGGAAFGSTPVNGTRAPSVAFDNNSGTSYFSNDPSGTGINIGYDYPANVPVGGVSIRADGSPDYAPKSVAVQYSAAGVWTTLFSFVAPTWTGYEWKTFMGGTPPAPSNPPLVLMTIVS